MPMIFAPLAADKDGFQRWTVNSKSFPDTPTIKLERGKRYRMVFVNSSSEAHPLHLHRHSFELRRLAGVETHGLIKDVVVVGAGTQVEVEFTADNPGATLFHCHQQDHMDMGFMMLFHYA